MREGGDVVLQAEERAEETWGMSMRPRVMLDAHESPVAIWKSEKRERPKVPKLCESKLKTSVAMIA